MKGYVMAVLTLAASVPYYTLILTRPRDPLVKLAALVVVTLTLAVMVFVACVMETATADMEVGV